jgi:hypothetical protein
MSINTDLPPVLLNIIREYVDEYDMATKTKELIKEYLSLLRIDNHVRVGTILWYIEKGDT